MRHNIHDIESYLPESSDKYLFDANVLLYQYYNFYSHRNYTRKYSKFFKEIIEKRAKLFLSSLILCEFVNAYLRNEAKVAGFVGDQYKKEFRVSQAYKNLIDELEPIVKKSILGLFNRINDDFESINIDDLFLNLKESDFNDEYSIHLCRKHNLKLVTS